MILNEDLFESFEEGRTNIKEPQESLATPKQLGSTGISDDNTIYVFEVAPDRESCPDTYRDEQAAREAAQSAGYNKMYKVGYTLKDETYVPSGYEEVIEISVPVLESVMSDLDVEIQNAGGKEAWLAQAYDDVCDIEEGIVFCNVSEKITDKDDIITKQQEELDKLKAKIKVVENS